MGADRPPIDAPYRAWADRTEVARWFGADAGDRPVRHSVRFTPEGVEADRAFVTLGPPRPARLALVRRAVAGLAAPEPMVAAIDRWLDVAGSIHVGHRASAGTETAKVYLEFPPGSDGVPHPEVRLLGFKWRLDGSGRCSVSRYAEPPEPLRLPVAWAAVPMVEITDGLAVTDGPEVTGTGSGQRHSLDVGLAPPWRSLRAWCASAEALEPAAGLPPGRCASAGVPAGYLDGEVGRLAVGTEAGRPFLTLYLTAPGQNDAK